MPLFLPLLELRLGEHGFLRVGCAPVFCPKELRGPWAGAAGPASRLIGGKGPGAPWSPLRMRPGNRGPTQPLTYSPSPATACRSLLASGDPGRRTIRRRGGISRSGGSGPREATAGGRERRAPAAAPSANSDRYASGSTTGTSRRAGPAGATSQTEGLEIDGRGVPDQAEELEVGEALVRDPPSSGWR